jgi:site-specific recombinase XerC
VQGGSRVRDKKKITPHSLRHSYATHGSWGSQGSPHFFL